MNEVRAAAQAKDQPPGVSVLVPSYNHAPFVEKCLRSIFRQTLPPRKLLVIDDGSRDGSPQIIGRVLGDCPFPSELIVRENRGLSVTLNEGFASCGDEYFAYLGSDDVWLPGFLESRARLLDSRPEAVLAFGHAFLIDERDRIFDCTRDWVEYREDEVLRNLLRGVPPVTSSVVFRRSALAGLGWNEDSILEDYELYLKLTARGAFAVDGGRVLAAWRQHDYNTSRDFALMMEEWLAAQRRVAPQLGIGAGELEKIQAELKFVCVADFIRHGKKRDALRMLWENRRAAAASNFEKGKMLARLLIPQALHRWQRRRKRRQKVERYGSIEI